MKYADMHCDALTAPAPLSTAEKLFKSGCIMQCFAYFHGGKTSFLKALKHLDVITADARFMRVRRFSDLQTAIRLKKTACALTVENLDWNGNMLGLRQVADSGAVMASLVWNVKNRLACPAFDGVKAADGGLTRAGEEAICFLDENSVIPDISHLSPSGAEFILTGRKKPAVASHSNAYAVCPHPRNLSDGLIKKIADCGGVIGLNFCPAFLGGEDTVALACAHAEHIIKVGGGDVLALGGDFDGMKPNADFPDCTRVPALLEVFAKKFGRRTAEKIAFGNFVGLFKEARP